MIPSMPVLLASRPVSMNIAHRWHTANKIVVPLMLTAVLAFVHQAAVPTVQAQQAS